MDWKIEALRLTLFQRLPIPSDQISSWWEAIVGTPAEIEEVNRLTGEVRQEGNFLNGRLVFEYKPNRIDWNIFPILDTEKIPPRLGEVEEIYPIFIQSFQKIFDNIDIKRIAVGTVCNRECDDHISAYKFLNEKLPYVDIRENSFEFNFQINRPRTVNLPFSDDFQINRLSKWNALKGLYRGNDGKNVQFYAAKCELDVNTDSKYQNTLPNSDIYNLFKLLVEFSEEILNKGDCE